MNRNTTIIRQPCAEDIAAAARILNGGELVAFPTETVYGLGADAFNASAVAEIFRVKRRPSFDPLIVHIADISQMDLLAAVIPEKCRKLTQKFWPGPLTVVVPKLSAVPDIVTAGLPNVGIRMPAHPVALELIRVAATPIAAPSANMFGKLSPTTAEHVLEQLNGRIDMILDGGHCAVGIESTVVSFTESAPVILRPGGIPPEAIRDTIGSVRIAGTKEFSSASPGRSLRHYAPETPLIVVDDHATMPDLRRKGLLTFTPEPELISADFDYVEVLSQTGDLNEAACNLFSALRRLDGAHLDVIIAKRFPTQGLGTAINDRLFRASQSRSKIEG